MSAAILYFCIYAVYAVVTPYLSVLLRGLGYSPSTLGILMGVFEGAGILGPFIFSYFSDRWGKYKPSLILTFILIILSAYPLISIHHVLFSAFAIAMLAIGIKTFPSLTDAVVTLQLGNSGNYGRVRTAGSLSFVLFVLFFQWIKFKHPNTPKNIAFWIVVTSIIGLAAVLIFLRERDTPGNKAAAFDKKRTIPAGKPWNPVFMMGIVMIAFGRFAMAPTLTFISLYVIEELKSGLVGFIWALSSITEIPMMYFSKSIINRFGAFNLLAVSSLAVGVRLGCYVLIPNIGGVILGQMLHSLCYGIFHPAAVKFVTDYVPPEKRATGLSIYISVGTGLPTFLGNTAGGFVLEYFGYGTLFASFIPFAVISVILYFVIRPHINRPMLR